MSMMTEKEKMLSGKVYRSRDPELIALYWKARKILHEFNQSGADPERMAVFRKLIPNTGDDVWVEPPFFCEYGDHVEIGRGTYININCFIQDCGRVVIGEDSLVGPGVQICTASHPVDGRERVKPSSTEGDSSYVTSAQPVTLGNRTWIGASATILGGVTIGDDVVIGAGSVVTRDIPAGSVAHGVPCRVVKTLPEA